jgi:ABC-2 type transport system permease protein
MAVESETTLTTKLPSAFGMWIRRNPVALKELRGRMRGARAFVVLTIYVALMSLFAVMLYTIYTVQASVSMSTTGGVVGKLIFGGVVAVELFLVCFIAPAFTSSAISGEKERRTFQILRTTLLPARRIVMGKLLSAMAYVVLLLLVAIPLQSLAFLMGGVTMPEVLISIEMLIVTAVGFGVVGLFFSATTERTLGASVLTYVVVLLVTVALPLAGLTFVGLIAAAIATSSPVTEAILIYVFGFLGCTNPVSAAILTEVVLLDKGAAPIFTIALSNGTNIPMIAPWIVYTVVYGILSVILIALTVRRVRRIEV